MIENENKSASGNDSNDVSTPASSRVCWVAVSSVICIVVGFLAILSAVIFHVYSYESVGDVLFFVSFICFVLAFLFGVASLVRIRLSSQYLVGKRLAKWGITCGLIIVLLSSVMQVIGSLQGLAPKLVCKSHLERVGRVLAVYAEGHDDELPTAERWCDLLIVECGLEPISLLCPYSIRRYGESAYILNENVVGMRFSEIPKDMVMVFETHKDREGSGGNVPLESREFFDHVDVSGLFRENQSTSVMKESWNQVGGPELLSPENHAGKGCNILFNNMSVKFVKAKDFDKLNWGTGQ